MENKNTTNKPPKFQYVYEKMGITEDYFKHLKCCYYGNYRKSGGELSFNERYNNLKRNKEEKYKRVIDFLNKIYINNHNFDIISILELIMIYDGVYNIRKIEDIDIESDVKIMYSQLLKDFTEFDEYYSISISDTYHLYEK